MGTSCMLLVPQSEKEGSVLMSNRINYDGYEAHMIPTLEKYWTDIHDIKNMMNKGEIRTLENQHDTEYYESRTYPEYKNVEHFKENGYNDFGINYVYLFNINTKTWESI